MCEDYYYYLTYRKNIIYQQTQLIYQTTCNILTKERLLKEVE